MQSEQVRAVVFFELQPHPKSLSEGEGLGVLKKEVVQHSFFLMTYCRNLFKLIDANLL